MRHGPRLTAVCSERKDNHGQGLRREAEALPRTDCDPLGFPTAFLGNAARSALSRVCALAACLFAVTLKKGPPSRKIDA